MLLLSLHFLQVLTQGRGWTLFRASGDRAGGALSLWAEPQTAVGVLGAGGWGC